MPTFPLLCHNLVQIFLPLYRGHTVQKTFSISPNPGIYVSQWDVEFFWEPLWFHGGPDLICLNRMCICGLEGEVFFCSLLLAVNENTCCPDDYSDHPTTSLEKKLILNSRMERRKTSGSMIPSPLASTTPGFSVPPIM